MQNVHDEKERVRMEHEQDLEKLRVDLIWAELETVRLKKEEDAKNAAIASALKEQERVDEDLARTAVLNAEREKEEIFKAQVLFISDFSYRAPLLLYYLLMPS